MSWIFESCGITCVKYYVSSPKMMSSMTVKLKQSDCSSERFLFELKARCIDVAVEMQANISNGRAYPELNTSLGGNGPWLRFDVCMFAAVVRSMTEGSRFCCDSLNSPSLIARFLSTERVIDEIRFSGHCTRDNEPKFFTSVILCRQ